MKKIILFALLLVSLNVSALDLTFNEITSKQVIELINAKDYTKVVDVLSPIIKEYEKKPKSLTSDRTLAIMHYYLAQIYVRQNKYIEAKNELELGKKLDGTLSFVSNINTYNQLTKKVNDEISLIDKKPAQTPKQVAVPSVSVNKSTPVESKPKHDPEKQSDNSQNMLLVIIGVLVLLVLLLIVIMIFRKNKNQETVQPIIQNDYQYSIEPIGRPYKNNYNHNMQEREEPKQVKNTVDIAKPIVEKVVTYYKDSQSPVQQPKPQPKGFSGSTLAAGVIGGAVAGAVANNVINKMDKTQDQQPNENIIPLDAGSFDPLVQTSPNAEDDIPFDLAIDTSNINEYISVKESEQKPIYSSDISFDLSSFNE